MGWSAEVAAGETGKPDGLAPKTVRNIHMMLSRNELEQHGGLDAQGRWESPDCRPHNASALRSGVLVGYWSGAGRPDGCASWEEVPPSTGRHVPLT